MLVGGHVQIREDVFHMIGFVMDTATVMMGQMRTLYIVLTGPAALVGGNVNKTRPAYSVQG